MNTITYKGKSYETRTFDAHLAEEDENGLQTITIASSLLGEAIEERQEVVGSEEMDIDNQIYFYVDLEFFDLDAETICRKHLDEPFVFINEYK